tara:strand:+ start:88 stop:264 length:177 start_codon:yes stop_codon:yes gene_type:complete
MDDKIESRVRQYLINTIKMLPHNDESFKLLKEMLIGRINDDKQILVDYYKKYKTPEQV